MKIFQAGIMKPSLADFASESSYDPRAKLVFKLLSKEERKHALSFYQVHPGDDLPPSTSSWTVHPISSLPGGNFSKRHD
jgi:hypothetical protein